MIFGKRLRLKLEKQSVKTVGKCKSNREGVPLKQTELGHFGISKDTEYSIFKNLLRKQLRLEVHMKLWGEKEMKAKRALKGS